MGNPLFKTLSPVKRPGTEIERTGGPSSRNIQRDPAAAGGDDDAWKLYVFRKSRDPEPTRSLLQQLRAGIEPVNGTGDRALDALVRAGEIETGLADVDAPAVAKMAGVVDELAGMVCGSGSSGSCLAGRLREIEGAPALPPQIRCSQPEGFSYYGLNPLDFADLATRSSHNLRAQVRIVGIRSVGSTLGAIVAAQLKQGGHEVDRITVRPEGEPYHRKTTFDAGQSEWIHRGQERQADFVIVDEGPGFSGSTFLSAAQALIHASVPAARIVLMGSRPFSQQSQMETANSWDRFRHYTIDYATHTPIDAARNLSEGAWRELLYPTRQQWPAGWIEQERIKHLSGDGTLFFKFEGFGRYGSLARQQAGALAATGLSPRLALFESGYTAYEFVKGRPLTREDVSGKLLSHIAEYCAFRVKNFPADNPDSAMLQDMLQVNLRIEFGVDAKTFLPPMERPVYADCRMHPHEWLQADDGRLLKTDAVGHGEGHQFPGPTDIAWDLAGTIVEWKLSSEEANFLVEEYSRRAGDRATLRVREYLLPYTVFRMAHCRMGAAAMAHRREGRYLHRLYREYSAGDERIAAISYNKVSTDERLTLRTKSEQLGF